MIYPVDSAIQHLNIWDQYVSWHFMMDTCILVLQFSEPHQIPFKDVWGYEWARF